MMRSTSPLVLIMGIVACEWLQWHFRMRKNAKNSENAKNEWRTKTGEKRVCSMAELVCILVCLTGLQLCNYIAISGISFVLLIIFQADATCVFPCHYWFLLWAVSFIHHHYHYILTSIFHSYSSFFHPVVDTLSSLLSKSPEDLEDLYDIHVDNARHYSKAPLKRLSNHSRNLMTQFDTNRGFLQIDSTAIQLSFYYNASVIQLLTNWN